MTDPTDLLDAYAKHINHRVIHSPSDLPPGAHAHPGMLTWCETHPDVLVLQDGSILTCNPGSPWISRCKIAMSHLGIQAERLIPATRDCLNRLRDEGRRIAPTKDTSSLSTSSQQQRLRQLIQEALNQHASDIHLEVRENQTRIRLRCQGELLTLEPWPSTLAREVIAVAFNQETDHTQSHFNPLVPQNAAMPFHVNGEALRLRLASLPAHQGFDVVMRLLRIAKTSTQSLEHLGYQAHELKLLDKALNQPNGAIIIAGPTGSGKTTTLAACLQQLALTRKIYSIEDPIEHTIPGATQIPVNTEHDDRGFANLARTALRMDPDVLALGEIRDEDTAKVMIRAAITGHLVLCTLHAHSALEIPTRLIDLGIPRALLANPDLLVCLIAQRLVSTLCPQCSIPIHQSPKHRPHLVRFGQVLGPLSRLRARGTGCEHCDHRAIHGRQVAAEMVWIDMKSRHYIQQADSLGWRNYLKQHGFDSYHTRLITLTQAGQIDPFDLELVIGRIDQFSQFEFNYRELIESVTG